MNNRFLYAHVELVDEQLLPAPIEITNKIFNLKKFVSGMIVTLTSKLYAMGGIAEN